MNGLKLVCLVFSMGAVTYLPRMMPLFLLHEKKLPKHVNSFMQFIPFAALGALIFPGVLFSTGSVVSALAGAAVALLLAFFNINVMLIVLGGIAGTFLTELFLKF